METPFLVGCILLGWTGLDVVVAGTPSGDRLFALLALASLALVFLRLGWPLARRITLDPTNRVVVVGGKRRPLPPGAFFELVAAPSKLVSGPLRYGVLLAGGDAEPLRVLSGDDPAGVLADLVEIRRRISLPIHAGWGLTRDAVPWLEPGRTDLAGARRPMGEDDPVEPTRRRITMGLSVGTAGAVALLILEIRGRTSRGEIASPISLGLPAIGVLLLGAITFLVGTLKPRLSVGTAITCEWRVGGILLKRRGLDRAVARRADVVSPSGTSARHLLVTKADAGFVAFRCDRAEGTAAVATLTTGATEARSSA